MYGILSIVYSIRGISISFYSQISEIYLLMVIYLNYFWINFFFLYIGLWLMRTFTLKWGWAVISALYYFTLTPASIIIILTLPSGLLYGLVTLHPLLLYTGLLLLLGWVLGFQSWGFLNFRIFTLVLLGSALSLGMVWGWSNSVWSFFWVNDSIEWILFGFFMYSLVILHTISVTYFINYLTIFSILAGWLVIFRLGLIWTRHSFFINLEFINYTLFLSLVSYLGRLTRRYLIIIMLFYWVASGGKWFIIYFYIYYFTGYFYCYLTLMSRLLISLHCSFYAWGWVWLFQSFNNILFSLHSAQYIYISQTLALWNSLEQSIYFIYYYSWFSTLKLFFSTFASWVFFPYLFWGLSLGFYWYIFISI